MLVLYIMAGLDQQRAGKWEPGKQEVGMSVSDNVKAGPILRAPCTQWTRHRCSECKTKSHMNALFDSFWSVVYAIWTFQTFEGILAHRIEILKKSPRLFLNVLKCVYIHMA